MMREWTREKRLRTRSENGTLGLGEIMTELLVAPKLVVLRGDLGMGKTTLVRGMAAALGADASEVTSPTFTLVHEYRGRKTRLIHLDLYRLENEAEVETTGLWEMADAGDALVMVEWGEKFASVMERADAVVSMEQGEVENERLLHVVWR
ncbi:tRNA (adenosine(37)-N6)-threonylcarbamoyltransferase complex ATPase subunit type 1 TsaE [Granulicella paludicola]|uniref:tRNA (adenosine(37)-N6)-threonylcarbamoyltransferase complex ATPase subunit type 1 TsaE n=1 Tax=Granulicella paludicola TaxID=474951 RepID=UPI0021E0A7F5|nr:tRNA (adenosine(37)-N6)-threonylcarbamoyltransferase complex ATPase subunit type 1 TsaE [Granulicella paludicola]